MMDRKCREFISRSGKEKRKYSSYLDSKSSKENTTYDLFANYEGERIELAPPFLFFPFNFLHELGWV